MIQELSPRDRVLKIVTGCIVTTALVEMALCQFFIKMTRMSAVEATGISLFAFIIFGLVSLFAVTRMYSSVWGKCFAILMTWITALCATWYLSLLFHDAVFFQNIYYALDRQTRVYEPRPLSNRILASIPLGLIIIGTAAYYLAGLTVLVVLLIPGRKKNGEA